MLNEKGLEAAVIAGDDECRHYAMATPNVSTYEAAITAYLSTVATEAPEDVAGVEPVAWRWRLKWEPGKWSYAAKVAFSPHALAHVVTDLTPLYPASALIRLAAERDEAEKVHQDFRLKNDREWKAKVDHQRTRAANLQARLTARAKSMLRLREALTAVHDGIEDEGDRTYFGSTNDADTFREAWQDLDAWAWDDIISDGKLTDIYEVSRKAQARAETAEAELATIRKALERAKEVIAPFAEFGQNNTDDDGWAGLRCERERINVWFGPSDFRAARRYVEEGK